MNKFQSEMLDPIFLVQTSGGIRFLTTRKDSYGRDFLSAPVKGEYFSEPFTTRLICDCALQKKGYGVFAGAYVGDLAIPAALAGMDVIGFEPDINSLTLLELNCCINNVSIRIECLGLSDASGSAYLSDADALSSIYEREGVRRRKGKEIRTVSLDEYFSERGSFGGSLNLLQFDMEGGEASAINGSKKIIDKFSPLLIVEIHSLYDDFRRDLTQSKTVRLLNDFGYTVYALRDYNTHHSISDEMLYELIPVDQCYTAGPHHGFNLLAFRDKMPEWLYNRSKIVTDLSPKLIINKSDDKLFKLT